MGQMRYAIVVNTPIPESGGEDVPRKDYMLVAQSLNAPVIGLARGYGTSLKAVEGLDVDVVIAADSPWVNGGRRQPNGRVPNKVRFVRCTPSEQRDLYSRSLFVVVPLTTANVQAGSLVIYESLAMGNTKVTTASGVNVDIVKDGETGYCVPPGDHGALRQAVERLLAEPD